MAVKTWVVTGSRLICLKSYLWSEKFFCYIYFVVRWSIPQKRWKGWKNFILIKIFVSGAHFLSFGLCNLRMVIQNGYNFFKPALSTFKDLYQPFYYAWKCLTDIGMPGNPKRSNSPVDGWMKINWLKLYSPKYSPQETSNYLCIGYLFSHLKREAPLLKSSKQNDQSWLC